MKEEIIKDYYGRIIGYVQTQPNGDKIGKDFYHRVVGYYDKRTNTTKDFYRRVVARGDALVSLITTSSMK